MYVNIDEKDLNKVNKEIIENNYKKTDRIENFKKVICIYSLIIMFLTLLIFSIYIMANNTSIFDVKEYFIFIALLSISFCGAPTLAVIKRLENNNSMYGYLFDQFFINIDSNKKELILMSQKTNIKINLIKGNIRRIHDSLILYHDKNIVAIIPLYKLMNQKYLLDEIEKNVEVIEYEN